jgi:hypothetical protein
VVATQVVQYVNDRRLRYPSMSSKGGGGGGRYSPVNTVEENITENKVTTGGIRSDHDIEETTVHSDSSKQVWGTGPKKRRAVISSVSSDSFS